MRNLYTWLARVNRDRPKWLICGDIAILFLAQILLAQGGSWRVTLLGTMGTCMFHRFLCGLGAVAAIFGLTLPASADTH